MTWEAVGLWYKATRADGVQFRLAPPGPREHGEYWVLTRPDAPEWRRHFYRRADAERFAEAVTVE